MPLRHLGLAALLLVVACNDSRRSAGAAAAPEPDAPSAPAVTRPAPFGTAGSGDGSAMAVGAGGGSVTAMNIRIAQGLYVLDPPLPGEPTIDGVVEVEVGGAPPPAGTVVDANGVPLVPYDVAGVPAKYWKVSAAGAQPTPGADGSITITARGAGLSRYLILPCPGDLGVTSSAALGASLAGAGSLKLGWTGELTVNATNVLPSDLYASAELRGFDLATRMASGPVSQQLVALHANGAELPVSPTGMGGYLAEVRWQGPYVTNFDSVGYCGRVKRMSFAK
jgi:hypothetical protein